MKTFSIKETVGQFSFQMTTSDTLFVYTKKEEIEKINWDNVTCGAEYSKDYSVISFPTEKLDEPWILEMLKTLGFEMHSPVVIFKIGSLVKAPLSNYNLEALVNAVKDMKMKASQALKYTHGLMTYGKLPSLLSGEKPNVDLSDYSTNTWRSQHLTELELLEPKVIFVKDGKIFNLDEEEVTLKDGHYEISLKQYNPVGFGDSSIFKKELVIKIDYGVIVNSTVGGYMGMKLDLPDGSYQFTDNQWVSID